MSSPAWRWLRPRSKMFFSSLLEGDGAIEAHLETYAQPHAPSHAQPGLPFLQPDHAPRISVRGHGHLCAGTCERHVVHIGTRARAHGDGQLLGTQHTAGHFSRAGNFATLSLGAYWPGCHARLQHPVKLFSNSAYCDY